MDQLKPMPIGVQHFRDSREQNKLYVDKTEIIHGLMVSEGKYFLSRPRRFGKSLLLDTLAELYAGEGSAALFKGLWIDGKWDFGKMQRPVVRYDFSELGSGQGELEPSLNGQLSRYASAYGIDLENISSMRGRQMELISQIHAKHGKVVILVDEYDKPITAHLENDMELVKANRDLLREFFGPFKSLGDKIELLFITGIARFTKTSLFSDLNHLNDLSMSPRGAAICGITQVELERDFEPYFPSIQSQLGLDKTQLLEKLREWYNGYHFFEDGPSVYNPFSLINFVENRKFGSYWYYSGMPMMMRRYFRSGEFRSFELEEVSEFGLQSFDIEAIDIVSLMFQTGYLTIRGYDPDMRMYQLGYPNQEVQDLFLHFYLSCQTGQTEDDMHRLVNKLRAVFYRKEYEELQERLNNMLEILNYDMFRAEAEPLVHALLHIAFTLVGMHTESEVHTRKGRCDMMIRARDTVHVLEFKFDETAEIALEQIKSKGYGQKWIALGLPVVAFGVNFDKATRSINGVVWEKLG